MGIQHFSRDYSIIGSYSSEFITSLSCGKTLRPPQVLLRRDLTIVHPGTLTHNFARSLKTIRGDREKLFRFVRTNGGTLADFNLPTVRAYIGSLQEARKYDGRPCQPVGDEPVSIMTVRNHVRVLTAFASWLEREEYTMGNVLAKLRAPKAPRSDCNKGKHPQASHTPTPAHLCYQPPYRRRRQPDPTEDIGARDLGKDAPVCRPSRLPNNRLEGPAFTRG